MTTSTMTMPKMTKTSTHPAPCDASGKVFLGSCPPCPYYDLAYDICMRLQQRDLAVDRRGKWGPARV